MGINAVPGQVLVSEAIDLIVMTRDPKIRTELETVFASRGWNGKFAATLAEAGNYVIESRPAVFVGDTQKAESGWPAFFATLTTCSPPAVVVLLCEDRDPGPSFQAFTPLIFHCLRKPAGIDYLTFVLEQAIKTSTGVRTPAEPGLMCDELTGLMNQNYLARRLTQEFKRAERYNYPLSLLVLTLDNLEKAVHEGEDTRDHILYEFSRFLVRFARGNDVVIRAGSEEFLLILPDTYKEGALTFSERMLAALRNEAFGDPGSRVQVLVSAGLANYPGDGVRSEQDLLDLAHRALDNAVRAGGDRVYTFKNISRDDIKGIVSRYQREENEKS